MERKIGEIFEYNGEWCQCVESKQDACTDCTFNPINGIGYNCSGSCTYKQVIFKKLEKVGEPYEFFVKNRGIILLQKYKMLVEPYINGVFCNIHYEDNTIDIEIKQNKEDMEERELGPHMAKVIDEATQKMGEEIGRQIEANINKQRMKPFSLELAKAGKPVCTRDGRKARIICFDKKGGTPIVGLIQDDGFETVATFNESGLCLINGAYNLMMLPEKKEGWINIIKTEGGDYCCKGEVNSNYNDAFIENINVLDNRGITVKIEWEE